MITTYKKLDLEKLYYFVVIDKQYFTTFSNKNICFALVYFYRTKFSPTSIPGIFDTFTEDGKNTGPYGVGISYRGVYYLWFEHFSEMIYFMNRNYPECEKSIHLIDTMTNKVIQAHYKGEL